jgi:hypothetical protein
MSLTKSVIQTITNDSSLRAKLMLVGSDKGEGKSEYTIKRWLQNNDDELTKPKYTNVIAAHTGLTLDEILEPVTA